MPITHALIDSITASVNLFDKPYYDFAGNQIFYGTPRNAMLTLNYKF